MTPTNKALAYFRYHQNLLFNSFDGTDGLCLDSFCQENLQMNEAHSFLYFYYLSKRSSPKGCFKFEVFEGERFGWSRAPDLVFSERETTTDTKYILTNNL